MPELSRPRLEALTSLRFFAAMHVVIFHLASLVRGPAWYQRLASVGHLGVSFFFVLSGFILVYTYAGRPLNPRNFWQARFARVYPAYAAALVAAFPYFVWTMARGHFRLVEENLASTCVLVVGLLQAWKPQTALSWNPVAWSLSAEAFFYLLFPLLLIGLSKLRARALAALLFGCWTLSLAMTMSYVVMRPDGVDHASSADAGLLWLTTIKFNPLVRLPEFVLGMAAGLLYLGSRKDRKIGNGFATGGIAGFAVVVAFSDRIPFPVLHSGLVAPLFAAVIFGVATAAWPATPGQSRWVRLLGWRGLVLLGDASYSLYLLHFVIIWAALINFGRAITTPVGITLLLLACMGAALVSYKLIEEPARRRLRPQSPDKAVPAAALWATKQAAVAGE